MSVNSTGANETAATQFINTLISGGVNVLLIGGGTSVSYTDAGTDISGYSTSSVSVGETALTISTPADFTGTADLSNDNQLDFGSVDIGVVDDVVIQNQNTTDLFVLADETNNPDTTGEQVTLPAGTTLYSLGNA